MSAVKDFYGRHYNLLDPYTVAVSELISGLKASAEAWQGFLVSVMHFHRLVQRLFYNGCFTASTGSYLCFWVPVCDVYMIYEFGLIIWVF